MCSFSFTSIRLAACTAPSSRRTRPTFSDEIHGLSRRIAASRRGRSSTSRGLARSASSCSGGTKIQPSLCSRSAAGSSDWLSSSQLGGIGSLLSDPADADAVTHPAQLLVDSGKRHLAEERQRGGAVMQQRIDDFVVLAVRRGLADQMLNRRNALANLAAQILVVEKCLTRDKSLHEEMTEHRRAGSLFDVNDLARLGQQVAELNSATLALEGDQRPIEQMHVGGLSGATIVFALVLPGAKRRQV